MLNRLITSSCNTFWLFADNDNTFLAKNDVRERRTQRERNHPACCLVIVGVLLTFGVMWMKGSCPLAQPCFIFMNLGRPLHLFGGDWPFLAAHFFQRHLLAAPFSHFRLWTCTLSLNHYQNPHTCPTPLTLLTLLTFPLQAFLGLPWCNKSLFLC